MESIFDDFGRILASIGEPLGGHFGHFWRHFGDPKKKLQKKQRQEAPARAPPGRSGGMRGSPGEGFGRGQKSADR